MSLTTGKGAAALFFCVYAVHALMPVSVQGDSRWTIPTALGILHGRGADLRDYGPAIAASGFYFTECVGPDHSRQFPISSLDQCSAGRLYAFFPVAVPILAAPFVGALELGLAVARPILRPLAARSQSPPVRSLLENDLPRCTPLVENLVSSLFTAAAVTALYLAAVQFLAPLHALAVALVFAFGTLLWSVVARALWTHSPSVFLNALLVLLLVRADGRRQWLAAAGAVLGLAFFVRATNVVPVVVLGLWYIRQVRWRALWVALGGAFAVLPFVLVNLDMYGAVLAPVFLPVRQGSSGLAVHSSIPQAVIANLVSPSRGLLLFMPFFLLLLIPAVWREPMPSRFRSLRPWVLANAGLHMLLVATHAPDWWGGFSYGPRYLSDILPYLMFLWAPVLPWAARNVPRRAIVGALVVFAVAVQFRGATATAVHAWNWSPETVSPARIWDWSDPQFLRR